MFLHTYLSKCSVYIGTHVCYYDRQVEKPSLASTAFTCLHLYIFGIYLVHVQVEAFLPVEKPSLGVIFCHANSQISTQIRKTKLSWYYPLIDMLFLLSTTISEYLDWRWKFKLFLESQSASGTLQASYYDGMHRKVLDV